MVLINPDHKAGYFFRGVALGGVARIPMIFGMGDCLGFLKLSSVVVWF